MDPAFHIYQSAISNKWHGYLVDKKANILWYIPEEYSCEEDVRNVIQIFKTTVKMATITVVLDIDENDDEAD